jgi:MFS family permease
MPSISVPMLIRILFLCYYASLGSLMPYLPVYYHSLGHGGLIIGMLGAVKPLTTFLVAPFWGILSDTAPNKFTILYASFLTSLVGQLLVAVRTDVAFLTCMVFVTAIFNAPVKSLIDSIVLDHLPNKADYGRMRLWGQLGFGIGSSCVGILLSKSKGVTGGVVDDTPLDVSQFPAAMQPVLSTLYKLWMGITGYRLLFLSYAALSIPTWWALRVFERMDKEKDLADAKNNGKLQRKSKKKNSKSKGDSSTKIWQGIQLLVTNADALLFFFLVFVVGTSSGLIENFAYVRMREVGGTGKEMGLSRLVSSAAGAPMFWCSGPLTERWGADRVLVMALLSYVFRFFLYASMRNPYHGLPAEALRGVTFAAFWSTGTIYAHRISPPGMSTTMVRYNCDISAFYCCSAVSSRAYMDVFVSHTSINSSTLSQLMFLNAMYGGLGQSMGAIIGGKLQSIYGTVQTFIYAGIFDLCFVGGVVLYLMRKKESSFRNPKPIMPVAATTTTTPKSSSKRR